jgi:hypothetical protein
LEPGGKARRGASRVHANEADGFETALTGLSALISFNGADELMTHRVRLATQGVTRRTYWAGLARKRTCAGKMRWVGALDRRVLWRNCFRVRGSDEYDRINFDDGVFMQAGNPGFL